MKVQNDGKSRCSIFGGFEYLQNKNDVGVVCTSTAEGIPNLGLEAVIVAFDL